VGLGLAVARGFAEAMGGTLDAEDTPGGGLTMVLSLRRAPVRGDNRAAKVAVQPTPAEKQAGRSGAGGVNMPSASA
ncbi:hypothetical protein, partial [Streptomyces sp. NPDC059862]|uniref:hypothetical protein n=1 Tax=unclassified Streptomyces TaxID=2593676 RepID=UPI0036286FB2